MRRALNSPKMLLSVSVFSILLLIDSLLVRFTPPPTQVRTEPAPAPAVAVLGSAPGSVSSVTVHSALDPLIPGQMVFRIPGKMEVDQTETVDVRIATQALADELANGLQGRGVPRDVAVQVAPVMTVELHGHGFVIEPLFGDPQRSVSDANYADWQWDVTPKSSGTENLEVVVAAKVGTDPPRYFTVQRQSISVTVNPVAVAEQFASTNWQWLFGLVPFGAFATWFRQRQRLNSILGSGPTPEGK